MGDGGKQRKNWKTAEDCGRRQRMIGDDCGRRRRMIGDDRGRWGTTQCCPSLSLGLNCQASLENDWTGRRKDRPSWSFIPACRASPGKDGTGRRNVVRPRPGLGRTDCSVANTGAFGWAPVFLGLQRSPLVFGALCWAPLSLGLHSPWATVW